MTGSNLKTLCAVGALAVLVAGCAPVVVTRGNMIEDDKLATLREGVSRKDDVEVVLGTPSAMGTFDHNTWYYIGQRTEKTAFFQPDVVERKVVVMSFDQNGTLTKVNRLDLDQARDVEMVDRVTPTAGKDLGFFEQILGNVGRFGGSSSRRSRGPGIPGGGP
ncbi:MAG: outer membrane protein assembly factor BamE [Azospirillum sp.]|nr:outer membrane protein assembly factor BamE [Azospirillum sp.]